MEYLHSSFHMKYPTEKYVSCKHEVWYIHVLHCNMRLGETVFCDANKYVACKRKFITTSVWHKKYSLHNYCVCTFWVMLGANCKKQVWALLCLSALSSWAPTGWIFCDIWYLTWLFYRAFSMIRWKKTNKCSRVL
jgi:hypothetical protein